MEQLLIYGASGAGAMILIWIVRSTVLMASTHGSSAIKMVNTWRKELLGLGLIMAAAFLFTFRLSYRLDWDYSYSIIDGAVASVLACLIFCAYKILKK